MESFDLEKAKRKSGLSEQQLNQLEKEIRTEFGSDEMMFELHFIRVLKAIKEGWVSLEEALSESIEV